MGSCGVALKLHLYNEMAMDGLHVPVVLMVHGNGLLCWMINVCIRIYMCLCEPNYILTTLTNYGCTSVH